MPNGIDLYNPARIDLQLHGLTGARRFFRGRTIQNNLLRDHKAGKIDDETFMHAAEQFQGNQDSYRRNQIDNPQPSLMKQLGTALGPFVQDRRALWQARMQKDLDRPNSIMNIVEQGARVMSSMTAPFMPILMQGALPATAGPVMQAFQALPQMAGNMMQNIGIPSMFQGINPAMFSPPNMFQGLGNMFGGMIPGMGQGAPGMGGPQGGMMGQQHGNQHFSPQTGMKSISIDGKGTMNAPKEVVDELNQLKQEYKEAETLSERAKCLEKATDIFKDNAGEFTQGKNGFKPFEDRTGHALQYHAERFMGSGRGNSELDDKAKALKKIKITRASDIQNFEAIITADAINTYRELLTNVSSGTGAKSVRKAVEAHRADNDGVNPERTEDMVISALGSNVDQKGLHDNQFQLLDSFFGRRDDNVSIDEMADALIEAVNGAASHRNNNHTLKQSNDSVIIVKNDTTKDTVYGTVRATSLYPSYVNTVLGGGNRDNDVSLELKDIAIDEGRWSGGIRLNDGDETYEFDLSTIPEGAQEDFHHAFNGLFESYRDAVKKGHQAIPGSKKIRLMLLKKFVKEHSESLSDDSGYFSTSAERKEHERDTPL